MRRRADGGEIDEPRERMQPRGEVARRVRRQPRKEVIAVQSFGADAPDASANFAAAFCVADAWIISPTTDAVGRGVAETHAMKWIRAPVIVRRDRLRVPVGGGDRRVHSAHAAALSFAILSAYALGSPP